MNTPACFRRGLFAALVTCLLTATASSVIASPAVEVDRLIASANYGKSPTLWFGSDPTVNLGSGPANWSAQSGGTLSARGTDPWGHPGGAYGPARDAKGGVAISGSTTSNIINPSAGTVILFFRPGAQSMPPMMLFSRADWGDPNYLSLRINAVSTRWELTLAAADARSAHKATQANFATITPGAWTFVALTWQEAEGRCFFRYWAGDLSHGELTEGEMSTAPLHPAPAIFVVAGRRADKAAQLGDSPLLLSDGLLKNFAIYDAPLSEDIIKQIFVAGCRR